MKAEFVITHEDGTRMLIAEKLMRSLHEQDFRLWTWLESLGDAELAGVGVLMFKQYEDSPSHMFVERLGMVCHLLGRRTASPTVKVAEEVLAKLCDLLSVFAGMTLARRRGLIAFDSLPEITASEDQVVWSLTSDGRSISNDLRTILHAVVRPN